MGIEIQHIGSRPDRFGLVFVCEACYRRIYDANDGIYCWGIKGTTVFRLHIYHSNPEKYPDCVKAREHFERHCEISKVTYQQKPLGKFALELGNSLENAEKA